jgi:acyl-CoA thioester hydrolase
MFHYEVRVPFADTDRAGIVWWGNFLRYVELAEDAFYREAGQHRAKMIKGPNAFELPRTDLRCTFESPARFDDVLDVALGFQGVSERRVRVRFEISQKATGRVVVTGGFEVACVDRSFKVRTILRRTQRGGVGQSLTSLRAHNKII